MNRAGNALHGGVYLLCERTQCEQIIAEDFDRDVCPRAREHVVDPMRDGLPDRDVHAGEECGLLTNLFKDRGFGPVLHRQIDIDLGRLNPLYVLVEFGAPGSSCR